MDFKEQWVARLVQLQRQAEQFANEPSGGGTSDDGRRRWRGNQAKAGAWLASATALVEAILPSRTAPHRRFIAGISGDGANGNWHQQVAAVAPILMAVKVDVEQGLFESVENQARAVTYTDLIEHAADYLTHNRTDVAGVIAGVAFEDVLRRLAEINGVEPGLSVANIIAELRKSEVLNSVDARFCTAAADVRNHAVHARWSEFGANNVSACIDICRQLVSKIAST